MKELCSVCVNAPIFEKEFTYIVPAGLNLEIGDLVKVPFGKRKIQGIVSSTHITEESAEFKVKEISEKISIGINLNEHYLELMRWISKYYHYPLGQVVFETLPKILKRPRPLKITINKKSQALPDLNANQSEVYQAITRKLDSFNQFCIHGITGSGKSLIYLKVISDIIKNNKSVLFLLPEINLTPQFSVELQNYLSVPVFSYHSELSNSQKFQIWKMAQEEDEPYVVLGVRSSVFLPFKNLGFIVVDEEHDQSFKQNDRLPYNARDIAVKRAQLLNIPIVLGSATPTVETYSRFYQGRHYFSLEKRFNESALPTVELINMNDEQNAFPGEFPFHHKSLDLIREALKRDEQVIVFANKLGYSNYLQCRSCGHRFECMNCSTNLRYFKKRGTLECTSCSYTKPVPESCPKCQCLNLSPMGFGTEKILEVINKQIPEAKAARFDRDEIKNLAQLEAVLEDFHAKKSDILVGTQMLSKGHNFKNVNTVVVLGIDSLLNFPDFRANERVYQLLTQVLGRAGRFGKKSKVYIQSHNDELALFDLIKNHSFSGFYESELSFRKDCDCPPFSKMVMIYMSSRFQDKLYDFSNLLSKHLDQLSRRDFKHLSFTGPRPATVEKRANQFTIGFLLKSQNINDLHNSVDTILKNIQIPSHVSLKVDVDPYFLA